MKNTLLKDLEKIYDSINCDSEDCSCKDCSIKILCNKLYHLICSIRNLY